MKLALVVQRYGAEVAGGSEAHCREVAERLAADHQVTVLTTCARDYISWRNEFPAGESREAGVRILRFRARQRNAARFWHASQLAFSRQARPEEEVAWFRENGPYAPELIRHLETEGASYDCVLFWTYRYYPSFAGLPLVADRAILLPTAEEDPAVRIRCLRSFFRQPAGFFFLTEEEAQLIRTLAADPLANSEVIGSGLDPAPEGSDPQQLAAAGIEPGADFMLYLGRVDKNKGCETLFEHYLRYVEDTGSSSLLVIAGKEAMPVPEHPQIRKLGFVTDESRMALLSAARFLVMPSPFESLSLVLLEAWNHSRPALVNGHCNVLRGQVRRADGGLYYDNYQQFREGADLLFERRETADQLGAQGLAYVEQHYRWPIVMGKIEHGLKHWPAR